MDFRNRMRTRSARRKIEEAASLLRMAGNELRQTEDSDCAAIAQLLFDTDNNIDALLDLFPEGTQR